MSEDSSGVTIGSAMPAADDGNGWVYSYCTGCMQADCSLKVYLKDGVVTNIEGNPESPVNKGRVCLRAIAGIMGLYNPYRVKTPLKRTNPEKGPGVDPGWVQISWDEAIDTIAARFRKIREEDPRKLAILWGFGAIETSLVAGKGSSKPGHEEHIFAKAFGTPNMIHSRPLCAIHYASNLVHAQHPEAISDLQYCDYLIAPGRTVGANTSTNHCSDRFINAIERGMKLVVIDPRFSPETTKAYRWLPIRPGTDLAFALAMIHGIFYEIKKFDEWSVKNRTNGPYLISPDGYYIRDASTGKPLIWDPVDNRAKIFSDPTIKDYALDGEYSVEGVRAVPALRLIKEGMKDYTPEWAEAITTIPAKTIREVTAEFVEHAQIGRTITIDGFEFPLRPAQIAGSGRGAVSHRNGNNFDLATKIINLLVGSMEVPGGVTGNRGPGPNPGILKPDEDGTVTPIEEAVGVTFKHPIDHIGAYEYYPHAHALPHLFARAVLDPEKYNIPYQLEAVFLCGANPIRATSDSKLLIEALRRVSFVVSFGLNFDESAMMSDILLPDTHFLERTVVRFCGPHAVTHENIDDTLRGLLTAYGRNGVKSAYDVRLMDNVLIDIADRAGFLRGRGGINDLVNSGFRLEGDLKLDIDAKYMIEEIMDRQVKNVFGGEYGFDFLLEHGVMYKNIAPGKLGYNYYYWPGNKTRFAIYFNKLKESGDRIQEGLTKNGISLPSVEDQAQHFSYYEAVPRWVPEPEGRVPPEFDMWACNWKTPFMSFGVGNTQENAWLSELRENDPYELYIWINAETARRKGLKNGQDVWVESQWGKTRGRLKLTELIHPEVLGLPGCYGSSTLLMCPYAREGPHFNSLLAGNQDYEIDPVHGGVNIGPRVKVYPAGGSTTA